MHILSFGCIARQNYLGQTRSQLAFLYKYADHKTICNSLMDIPDLDAALRSVRRVLKSGGWFVFVIGHPCFLAPNAETVSDDSGRSGRFIHEYRQERFWRSPNPKGVRRVGNYHRTLSTYLNALHKEDLIVEEAEEPLAEPLLAQRQPVYKEVPIFLAMRARVN